MIHVVCLCPAPRSGLFYEAFEDLAFNCATVAIDGGLECQCEMQL
jgi:hypothetical protein